MGISPESSIEQGTSHIIGTQTHTSTHPFQPSNNVYGHLLSNQNISTEKYQDNWDWSIRECTEALGGESVSECKARLSRIVDKQIQCFSMPHEGGYSNGQTRKASLLHPGLKRTSFTESTTVLGPALTHIWRGKQPDRRPKTSLTGPPLHSSIGASRTVFTKRSSKRASTDQSFLSIGSMTKRVNTLNEIQPLCSSALRGFRRLIMII